MIHTICPRSIDQFFIVTYYIKWVTTCTDSIYRTSEKFPIFLERVATLKLTRLLRHILDSFGNNNEEKMHLLLTLS